MLITCGFSSFCLNSIYNSASNDANGESVPLVKIIDLGFSYWIFLNPTPALKHQKPITLLFYISKPLFLPFLKTCYLYFSLSSSSYKNT